jgi:hypothetical protein
VYNKTYNRGEGIEGDEGDKENEGDEGNKGDVRDVSNKVLSYNNLSFIKASFNSTLNLIKVLKELRSFNKLITFKSLFKDK